MEQSSTAEQIAQFVFSSLQYLSGDRVRFPGSMALEWNRRR